MSGVSATRGPTGVGATRGPIVVVLNEFPKRSETFLFRELVAWRERGLDVRPFSLLPAARRLPDEMAPWREDTIYLHQQLSPALALDLLRGIATALVSPAATWRSARGSGRLRDAVAGWLAGAALARLGQGLAVRRFHAAWANAPAEAALRASRELGVPYTVSVHAVDLWCDTAPGAPRLTDAESLYACNRAAAAALVHANPRLEPRVRLVPHTLPPPGLFPLVERAAGPPWRLLAVGRLVPKKGLDRLVGLCRRLRDSRYDVDCRIFGEGPLAHSLGRRIAASGLGARVRLVGATDQAGVARAMAESHLLVAPSRIANDGDREGLPNVLLEALLTGLPVLATRTGSVEEVLVDGVTGRLVPADDDGALAAAAIETLDDYPRALARGRAGREAVLARQSREDQATALARVFAS